MFIPIRESWREFLATEFQKPYFATLWQQVMQEYASDIYECYPPKELLFSAFDYCNPQEVKVVILGQDPYHGKGEANGLCFSVADGLKIPPSLRNIFQEINLDFERVMLPTSGNLARWAAQGVLLLNSSLSVRANLPNSHKHLPWHLFTDEVIRLLSDNNNNTVFLLWGAYAQKKARYINPDKHLVLTSGHPSPFSAMQKKWFGHRHFSQTNAYLVEHGKVPIDW
jgi:uracil-DNA glycosylase